MGSEWITYSIDEIATVKSGKRLPKDESLTDKKTSYPYIRLVDVNQGKIDASKIQYLEPKTQSKISRYIVETNDVCLAIVGHTIGMVFYVEDEWNKANLTENAARLTDISSSFNPRYIYYYLISPAGQSEIISRKVGSAQGKLPLYNIKELKIKAPDRITQDHIVDVLLSLDNKMTLNRQINQTLEQMAQTLFKSWFVDFDPVIDNALDAGFFEQDLAFSEELLHRVEMRKAVRQRDDFKPLAEDIRKLFPNAFEECAEPTLGLGGWVPKGWFYSSIYESMDIIFGAPFKSNLFNELGEGKPIIRIRDLKTGSPQIFSVEQHPKKTEIVAGDIIVGMDAEFRATIWSGDDAYLNQRLFLAKPKDTNISNLFIKYSLAPLLAIEEMAQVGTTVAHLGKKDIDKFNIIISNSRVLTAYKKQSDDFLRKIVVGMKDINTLTKLRDILLPKLISGELSLSELKIDIPEETLI